MLHHPHTVFSHELLHIFSQAIPQAMAQALPQHVHQVTGLQILLFQKNIFSTQETITLLVGGAPSDYFILVIRIGASRFVCTHLLSYLLSGL